MRLTTGYEKRSARIEMIPLLDCIFLLLLFFIYAMLSMNVHRGIRVTLPRATGRAESTDVFSITLAADNRLLIDGNVVSLDDAVLTAIDRAGAKQQRVLISGDRQADLGIAIELLSRLRSSGIEAVSFLVEEPAK